MDSGRAGPGDFDYEDPNLEEKLVNELKAQGIFDQFRKDCLSDVDTKPAYQNLRVRVDKSVSSYLSKTTWRPSLNKNQLRNQLRKYIQDMSGVEAGVDRIVDQIVNPKLNSTFLPEVEDVIYKCFGTSKPEETEDDLVNGNGEEAAAYNNQNGTGDNHNDSVAGKISTRNLSAISSDAEMMNVETGSGGSSPGPGLAGQVSPLTPGASPSVNQGDISPLTPANTPPQEASSTPTGTPPPPPPGEEAKTEEVGMEVDVEEEERPASAYTPPLPPASKAESPSYTPPPRVSPVPHTPALPPPPPPPPESGGEASMSSISDTDLGDISPPRPAPPRQETEAVGGSPGSGSGSDEDLHQLMKMKAELMAQLEGDFKLSPEESDEEDDDPPQPSDGAVSGVAETAPTLSSSSGSPSPPPAKVTSPPVTPPGEEMAKLSVDPSGCKPFSPPESKSPPSGDGGAGPALGPAPGPPGPSSGPSTATSTGSSTGGGSGEGQQGGQEGQNTQSKHSHHSHHSHHSSKSHSSSRHHSSSMSKEEKRKNDKLKQQHKAKIEKYEERIKSKDKLKSDKYQSLDIFSNTKKPGTPYLPTVRGQNSGSSTPNTPKPQKKEFEKKLDEQIRKELERREEKRKERNHSDKSFKTPVRTDERRSSSDKERGSDRKERRSSKDERHDSHSSRHRHDSDRKHKDRRHSSSSDKERRHSSSSGEKQEKDRRSSTESKYSKEREIQEMESKRRLQEARLKKEREEKEKSRSSDKDKRAREGDKSKHSKDKKETQKVSQKPKDEINDLLKEKINSLGVDNIQKMLMESLVEKTGAKVSDEEKQKMMAKMEDIFKEKKPATQTQTATVAKKVPTNKPSPKKKRNVSGATSSSSSGVESDDEIKEMKMKVKKSPSGQASRPVRQRKVRKFEMEEDKSDSDGDFVTTAITEDEVSAQVEDKKVVKEEPKIVKKPISVVTVQKTDDDPKLTNFHSFNLNDVERMENICLKLKEVLSDEDSIDIGSITEADINEAIPSSRVVLLDAGSEPQTLLDNLSQFGGNPRLITPVPEWLNPYLVGAKVKLEDVEMPSKEEVREYLQKKNTGKRKRGAGWDIVVDWVPQEQSAGKRSKIEKELGFDFDSSFGCSINASEGRRSRRSNIKPTSVEEVASPKVKNKNPVANPEVSEEKAEVKVEDKAEEASISPESPAASEDRAEVATDESPDSPGKKRNSQDIIEAYLTTAGVEQNEEIEGTEDNSKVLANLDDEIKKTDQELESVLTFLKNKRKRHSSGDGKFHGWASTEAKAKKAAYNPDENQKLHLDTNGTTFGLTEFDFVTFEWEKLSKNHELEVIFSQPMLQDLKKLESNMVPGITQIKQLSDSEQDDRGSQSPDSYGSSKENDPEIVNSVSTIYKQSKVSTRKKTNTKNPVLKTQVEVS